MHAEVRVLKERLEQLEQDHSRMKTQWQQAERLHHRAARRFRVLGGLAVAAVVGAMLISPGNRAALAQGYGITLQQLLNRLKSLETKTQFVSIGKDGEMHIVGTNLHIENGLGFTNGNSTDPFFGVPTVNGKGNVIIGYNESQALIAGTDIRTGSHNLILGDGNNYSSYGGLVVGEFNTISGPYASVSAGEFNVASGIWSSISGGNGNAASSDSSCVSGGTSNVASGSGSAISGGSGNAASGPFAWVSGGVLNTASGNYASVIGGENNTARGHFSAVSGGGNDRGTGIVQRNFLGWSAGGTGNGGPGAFHSP